MAFITDHILTWVAFAPALGAVLVLAAGRTPGAARRLALGAALVDFVLSLHLLRYFETGNGADQFVEHATTVDYLREKHGLTAARAVAQVRQHLEAPGTARAVVNA